MDTIDTMVNRRLDKTFKAYPDTEEMHELREELAADLSEAAHDNEKKGAAITDAVNRVFEGLGNLADLVDEINAEKNATDQDTHSDDANDDTFSNFDQQFNEQEPVDTEIYVDSLALANEQQFSADQVQRINFKYADSSVRILSNPDDDHIIFREYMNRANDSYLAQTKLENGTLSIHNGSRPHLLPLRVRVQLLIPASFTGDLLVNSASGSVNFSHTAALNQVRLEANSGSIRINGARFKDLDVNASSGSVRINQITVAGLLRARAHSGSIRLADTTVAKFDVDTHSGSVRGTDLIGAGAFNANSGSINLSFSDLTGNLDTTAHSSSIKLEFAKGIKYNFDLDANSGSITGPDNAIYDHNTTNFKDGAVGDDPHFYVTAATKSSSIHIS